MLIEEMFMGAEKVSSPETVDVHCAQTQGTSKQRSVGSAGVERVTESCNVDYFSRLYIDM